MTERGITHSLGCLQETDPITMPARCRENPDADMMSQKVSMRLAAMLLLLKTDLTQAGWFKLVGGA